MNLVRASLRHPQVVYVLTGLLCLAGILALRDMPRREDPKIAIRRGLILAAYPGATAEQVEQQVTKKIEERLFAFGEVRKNKTISTSMVGGVAIDVALEDAVVDADKFWSKLRHDLNELHATDLPQGVLGPIVNSDFGDVIAVLLSVSGENYGNRELQTYLERVETELLRLPAVSKVKRVGEQKEKIYVTSTMQRLVQYGITPLHLVGALQSQNLVAEAGAFDADQTRARIHTTGLYRSEDQIRRQMVGMSPMGTPMYLGDMASVERRYADPDFLVRANGKPTFMLTLEMREGYNIVQFGREIEATVERVKAQLPSDLQVTAIINQPAVVEERISHFLKEFGLALISVIAVTLILLPLRVATVAAMAIPVTVMVTFAILRGLGIELHQVSLAALIVVLGMVVDDAIVIADNYVELLDHGLPKDEASWRAASDLAVPVFAATITIAASFLPLAFLPGSMGEFMFSLPVTVAIALLTSYVVAMLLTPLLCRAFIKQGLVVHTKEPAATDGKRAKRGALDVMQAVYDRAIAYAMNHKRLTMAFGIVAVAAGAALGRAIPQQFFPPAERDEFAINVWMPEGTRLEATDAVVRKIEAALAAEHEVKAHASFVGEGAPRFFFSFEPAFPRSNVAQIIVRTSAVKATPGVVRRLRDELPRLAPQAELDVQRLTQGDPMWAPVEVRIAGPELAVLESLGDKVARQLEGTPGSFMVRNDFRENAYALEVNLKPEVANRLGMTNTVVSNMLAGTFLGLPVSTFWEGDHSVDIVLRLDESHRSSIEDVGSTYVVSQMGRMPLRGVATMRPVWERSRIVHRNGVRTLTVGSFSQEGILPSRVLAAAKPRIDTIALPAGYDVSYGGEIAIQTESFGHLSIGMLVSVLLIFLILLFLFQTVKEALIIMVSIPLALFGAYFGLLITRNPFGFTAFMGLISLSGVVVRNAIILIDFIRERLAAGGSLEEAALEAGRRRLRPIFLTTVAAAAGLTPMILSGSGLWSPLASVIAVGLIFSMVFTLLVVPVLYVLATRRSIPPSAGTPVVAGAFHVPSVSRSAVTTLLLCICVVPSLWGQGTGPGAAGASAASAAVAPRALMLDQALALARESNAGLRAVRQRVQEAQRHNRVAFSNYLPRVKTQAGYMGSDNTRGLLLPAGSLGYFSDLGGPFPRTNRTIPQGGSDLAFALTMAQQPLTQFFKIREGVAVTRADEEVARAELRRAEQAVALGVIKAYAGVLIASRRRDAARERVTAAGLRTTTQTASVQSGMAPSIIGTEAKLRALQARQELLEAENEYTDISYALADAIGLPGGTVLTLEEPPPVTEPLDSLDAYVTSAMLSNADVLEAEALVKKATHGIAAAKTDYIPDLGLFGGHFYQSSVPFFPKSTLMFGAMGSFTILDFGARRNTLAERRAQRGAADGNLDRIRGRVRGDVEAAYRKLGRAREMTEVAREALALRSEALRMRVVQMSAGYGLAAEQSEATADRLEAALNVLRAEMGYRIARAELDLAAGRLAR